KGKTNSLSWINKYHTKIHEYINNNFENKNSIKSHVSTLAKILKLLNNEKAYLKYSAESTSLNKQVVNQSKEQLTDDKRKDNFVCFDDIVKRREELKERFNANRNDNKTNLLYVMLA